MKPFFLILSFTLLVPARSFAGDPPWYSPKHLLGTPVYGLYDPHEKEWNGPALWTAAAGAEISYILYQTADPEQNNSARTPALGAFSRRASDFGTYAPLILPAAFLGAGLFHPQTDPARAELFGTAEQMIEALGYTWVTSYALKSIARRRRPSGNEDNSFPSNHASLNFAAAGVLAERYPWYIGLPSLMAASAVAVARVDLNTHFTSDVAAGAAIGLFYASAVTFYHRHPAEKRRNFVAPLVSGGTAGAVWSRRF